MTWLGEQHGTVFLGQSVAYPGTAMFGTLAGVPMEKRIELPVAEEMQLGICTGMSLAGYLPISIYPRWNFLLLAMNQLVNHLDKYSSMSDYRPKVIIRVGIGAVTPLWPGEQHLGDFSGAVEQMLHTIEVIHLDKADEILGAYQHAFASPYSSIVVEDSSQL